MNQDQSGMTVASAVSAPHGHSRAKESLAAGILSRRGAGHFWSVAAAALMAITAAAWGAPTSPVPVQYVEGDVLVTFKAPVNLGGARQALGALARTGETFRLSIRETGPSLRVGAGPTPDDGGLNRGIIP